MYDKYIEIYKNGQDAEYLGWLLASEGEGYVLNTNEKRNSKYSRLHKSSCTDINNDKTINWTNHGHEKVCSSKKEYIEKWCLREGFKLELYCKKCNP